MNIFISQPNKYAPINSWTKQQIIDKINSDFKGRSYRPTNKRDLNCAEDVCLYRGDNGRKCIVGVFIPDREYSNSMESSGGVKGLLDEYPLLTNMMPLSIEVLSVLQSMHDSSRDISDEELKNNLISWVERHVT